MKTDPAAEREMRQAIRDLVANTDPYGRLDPEAEDVRKKSIILACRGLLLLSLAVMQFLN